MQECGAQTGQTIRRQFYHQRFAASGQNRMPENQCGDHGKNNAGRIGAGENQRGFER